MPYPFSYGQRRYLLQREVLRVSIYFSSYLMLPYERGFVEKKFETAKEAKGFFWGYVVKTPNITGELIIN